MKFYPANASLPEEKRTDRVFLRPLLAMDVELDYNAVMSSAEQLRRWSQSTWPPDDFTLAQNLKDLERHEREHVERKAFTYTVLNPQATQCLGCVYIEALWPEAAQLCPEAEYPAVVSFWVRTTELPNNLDRYLLESLREWFRNDWAFDCVLFGTSPQDTCQPTLFADSGLEQRLTFPLRMEICIWFSVELRPVLLPHNLTLYSFPPTLKRWVSEHPPGHLPAA